MSEKDKMRGRNFSGDTLAGVTLFTLGSIVVLSSLSYEIGSLRRMGPGYFPLMLGTALCILSLPILWDGISPHFKKTQKEQDKKSAINLMVNRATFRPMFLPLIAVIMFALLLENAGLIPAVFTSVTVAGFAEKKNSLMTNMLVACLSSIFIAAVFVYGLGLPLRLVVI